MKALYKVNEDNHIRPKVIRFTVCDTSTLDKSMEEKKVDTWLSVTGERLEWGVMADGHWASLWSGENALELVVIIAQLVQILRTTEIHTSKRGRFYCSELDLH